MVKQQTTILLHALCMIALLILFMDCEGYDATSLVRLKNSFGRTRFSPILDSSYLEKSAKITRYRTYRSHSAAADSLQSTSPEEPSSSVRKDSNSAMQLMWCNNGYCRDVIRERTIGSHNHFLLTGPATGQVAYVWDRNERQTIASDLFGANTKTNKKDMANIRKTRSVLVLVKHGDDELMSTAADVVRNLTMRAELGIEVLLDPSVAARLKHYHGVDGDLIHLFEVTPTPGFGNNLRQRVALHQLDSFLVDESAGEAPPWESDCNGAADTRNQSPEMLKSKGFRSPDLICTLGGDGLLMHAGMMFQGPMPPILCVSGGSMGFLTSFHPWEMVDAISVALGIFDDTKSLGPPLVNRTTLSVETIKSKHSDKSSNSDVDDSLTSSFDITKDETENYHSNLLNLGNGNLVPICISIRMRLECRIINREGVVRSRWNVLNEVVIDRGGSPYLAALECFCDDEHLTTVQADGIIFATPTGSTAYSLAAGSSVVHPAVPCILVTPICPHVLSFRSMVFPDHVVLRCLVPQDARADASVAFDGKHRQELRRGDSVLVQMSPYPVPTINRKDHSADWLGSLKRNFNFNARPRQKPFQT